MSDKLIIYTDGASRGNPGHAGIGVAIYTGEELVEVVSEYIGQTTNNVAEYYAFIKGLEKARDLGAKEVDCYLDSELLVKQLSGEYRVKNEGLKPLYSRVRKIINDFNRVTVKHVPREENKVADKMANQGIDAAIKKE